MKNREEERRDDSWHPLFFSLCYFYCCFLSLMPIDFEHSWRSFTRCVISSIERWRECERRKGRRRRRRKTLKEVAQSCQGILSPRIRFWLLLGEENRFRNLSFSSFSSSSSFLWCRSFSFRALASNRPFHSYASLSLSLHPLSLGSIIWNAFLTTSHLDEIRSRSVTVRKMKVVRTYSYIIPIHARSRGNKRITLEDREDMNFRTTRKGGKLVTEQEGELNVCNKEERKYINTNIFSLTSFTYFLLNISTSERREQV